MKNFLVMVHVPLGTISCVVVRPSETLGRSAKRAWTEADARRVYVYVVEVVRSLHCIVMHPHEPHVWKSNRAPPHSVRLRFLRDWLSDSELDSDGSLPGAAAATSKSILPMA
jgi:hypothetical protein